MASIPAFPNDPLFFWSAKPFPQLRRTFAIRLNKT
jgi:hypothetical protein